MPKRSASPGYPILNRLFGSAKWDLSSDAARSLLQLAFDDKDRARMHELARKASSGQLTFDEEREADFYEFLGLFLDLLHSKARVATRPTKQGA